MACSAERRPDQLHPDGRPFVSILRQNWPLFQPYITTIEWADNMVDVIEHSRNVIMHSGVFERRTTWHVGVFIRDWIRQVGT